MTTIILLLLCASAPQDPVQEPDPGPQQDQETAAKSPQVEELRNRIHEMRMSLVLGGDSVRSAESEAVEFYGNRIGLIDQRLDAIAADRTEKQASYDIILERLLVSENGAERLANMGEAQTLRLQLEALERETRDLNAKRSGLNGLIAGVETRGREREKLRTRLEVDDSFEGDVGLSLGSVGLAPDVELDSGASPLDDDLLIQDLLTRDVSAARRLIFEVDPEHYWQRFPLRPPAGALREALGFPPPDLPGGR